MQADKILTLGIDYKIIHGGIAAVENVYSTFYKPFNHITTVVDYGKLRKAWVLIRAIFEFCKRMVFQKEIHIVHIHAASDISFCRKSIFIVIAKLFGKRVIFHSHGAELKIFTNQHPIFVKKVLGQCDCIIALSQSWKEWFMETFNHPNVVVIKNIIAAPQIKEVEKDGKLRLLFLGRLGKRKGFYDLIEVLYMHRAEFKGRLEVLFGGDGEVEEVCSLIKEYQLGNIAKYQGWVNSEKRSYLLNFCDVYILPSYNEGLPISILEAMSYSLPVISTNVGGIPEVLRNNENGFLIEPGDKQGMYDAIHFFMEHRNCVQKFGKISCELVTEHFPEFVEKQLTDLYCNLF